MDEMSAPGHVKFTPPARGSIYGFAYYVNLTLNRCHYAFRDHLSIVYSYPATQAGHCSPTGCDRYAINVSFFKQWGRSSEETERLRAQWAELGTKGLCLLATRRAIVSHADLPYLQ
jgi:hypothetical protein